MIGDYINLIRMWYGGEGEELKYREFTFPHAKSVLNFNRNLSAVSHEDSISVVSQLGAHYFLVKTSF
jgi:hypothetical protein